MSKTTISDLASPTAAAAADLVTVTDLTAVTGGTHPGEPGWPADLVGTIGSSLPDWFRRKLPRK